MHTHTSILHDACSNSWSDTVRVKGPTGRRSSKGGVSGPAKDLRPVSEVEAGVNFRTAGGVRGQVANSLPRRQPVTGTRWHRVGAVTPSLHPEVPDTRFASPGRGLGIRQSMGWTKVCSTARWRIWVLKGNARDRMLLADLDHLRVGWRKRRSYEIAWVTPGHDCLCPHQYGRGAPVRPQTNDDIWDGVISFWSRVAHFLSPWCARGEAPLLPPWCARVNVPMGVNLNRYSGSGSCIPWHSDNESLFGPPIVSMSLGHSVEFQVRRVRYGVSSPLQLDRGDILVMDGVRNRSMHTAPSLGCRVLGLTLPVGYTTRCVLSTCRRGGLCSPNVCAKFPLVGDGGKQMVLFWGFGPPFVNPGVCPPGQHLDSDGLGDDVGNCHDAACLLRESLALFLEYGFVLFDSAEYASS